MYYLSLENDEIYTLDSGVFNGLKTLKYLHLDKSNITRIMKGAFENSGSLCYLSLTGNPIKKLENETLHNFVVNKRCEVNLLDVPIEMIHGGVFARRNDSSCDCQSNSKNMPLNV